METLEGETLTTEDISHKLNIDFDQAKVLAAAPALLVALEQRPSVLSFEAYRRWEERVAQPAVRAARS